MPAPQCRVLLRHWGAGISDEQESPSLSSQSTGSSLQSAAGLDVMAAGSSSGTGVLALATTVMFSGTVSSAAVVLLVALATTVMFSGTVSSVAVVLPEVLATTVMFS